MLIHKKFNTCVRSSQHLNELIANRYRSRRVLETSYKAFNDVREESVDQVYKKRVAFGRNLSYDTLHIIFAEDC